jgi:hypothetical protein
MSISKTTYITAHRSGIVKKWTSKPNGIIDKTLVRMLNMPRAERFYALEKAVPGCFKEEMIVKTNTNGTIQGLVPKSERDAGGIFPASLLIIINQENGNLVTFRRGTGASDMHDLYSLLSGTMNSNDMRMINKKPGDRLKFDLALTTMIREMKEEAKFDIPTDRIKNDLIFEIQKSDKTTIKFFAFLLALSKDEIKNLNLDNKELDGIKEYSAITLHDANDVGHAIQAMRGYLEDLLLRLNKRTG